MAREVKVIVPTSVCYDHIQRSLCYAHQHQVHPSHLIEYAFHVWSTMTPECFRPDQMDAPFMLKPVDMVRDMIAHDVQWSGLLDHLSDEETDIVLEELASACWYGYQFLEDVLRPNLSLDMHRPSQLGRARWQGLDLVVPVLRPESTHEQAENHSRYTGSGSTL